MRLNLMVEGQEDVTWPQWLALAEACESSELEGLFRSDHYLSVQGEVRRGSLDAWTTLAGLAAVTSRIRLGTLVSPATFRHPSAVAKSVTTVDHISRGRVELGLGAGWLEAEHRAYGFDFAANKTRLDVLEEQLEIVHRSWTEESFSFAGDHYRLDDLNALPKPVQEPHPNLILGGSGGPRSAALAARWADEYNTVFPSIDACRERRAAVERAFEARGRDPGELVFSVMTGFLIGANTEELNRRARAAMDRNVESGDSSAWLDSLRDASVAGTIDEAVERIGALAEAGVDRLMLQHQDHSDIDAVALLGTEVASQVSSA